MMRAISPSRYREANGSIKPINKPPSRAPGRLPKPPMTAAAKAFIPSKPVDGSIAFFDANKIPAMAATMPDKAQIIELTRLTGIPI